MKKEERRKNSPSSVQHIALGSIFICIFVVMSLSPTTKRAKASSTKGMMKPGAKKGGSRKEISKEAWYAACVTKNSTEAFKRMTMTAFLKSAESGEQFTGTRSQRVSFAKYLKQHENGELPGHNRAIEE
jgi:hypothetical protein